MQTKFNYDNWVKMYSNVAMAMNLIIIYWFLTCSSGKLWSMKNKFLETPCISSNTVTVLWFSNSGYIAGTISRAISGLMRCCTLSTSQCIPLLSIRSNSDTSRSYSLASLYTDVEGRSCWWSPVGSNIPYYNGSQTFYCVWYSWNSYTNVCSPQKKKTWKCST